MRGKQKLLKVWSCEKHDFFKKEKIYILLKYF